MSRLLMIVLPLAAVVGVVYICRNYTVDLHRGQQGNVEYVKFVPRDPAAAPAGEDADLPPVPAGRSVIRIAAFDTCGLDEAKLANQRVADVLVRTLAHFDVVALQGVRGKSQGTLVRLVEQINATGRSYDFATSPTAKRDPLERYSAVLFDRASVEVDRSTVRFVADPAGKFRYKPLVAAFRVRGPGEAEAFTFTLVNVQTNPERVAEETECLAQLYRTVRDDGRGEDDIILLGNLETDPEHLGQLGRVPNLVAAVPAMPTTTRGTRRADNILFDRRATIEFTGRAGVFDLMRECDLPQAAALEVSEHLPVWAEFSIYEGGQPGHVP